MRALTISRLGLILQRHSILATQEYGIPKYQRDKPQQIQKTAAETSYHHILTGSFFSRLLNSDSQSRSLRLSSLGSSKEAGTFPLFLPLALFPNELI